MEALGEVRKYPPLQHIKQVTFEFIPYVWKRPVTKHYLLKKKKERERVLCVLDQASIAQKLPSVDLSNAATGR